jgi:PAP2 superfamily
MGTSRQLLMLRKYLKASTPAASKARPIVFIAITACALLILSSLTGIRFVVAPVIWLGVAALFAISLIYGLSGRSQPISEMAFFGALWICLTAVGVMFTYLAATLQYPLFDSAFSKLDRSLGFDWLAWYHYVESSKFLNLALALAYATGLLQILGAIFYFAHTKRFDRNSELWWVAIISLLLTSLVSGIVPAMGTFHHHNIGLERAIHLSDLVALRDASRTVFKVHEMQGIITLPSYHTVLAIIFMYAFRGIPIWFFVSAVLNILMLISTPSHGGHYLVDMIAGAAVAVVTIIFVRTLLGDSASPFPVASPRLLTEHAIPPSHLSSKIS